MGNTFAQAMYAKFTGKNWFNKMKVHIKTGSKKIGLKIKAGTKKAGEEAKKIGLKIKAGAKKTGAAISDAAKKLADHVKAGAAKISAGIKGGVHVKASVKPKVHVKANVKVGKRRLQSATTTPTVEGSATGLNTSAYSSDVEGVPATLEGDGQEAPAFANLMKISFAAIAMVIAMF